MEFGKYHTIKSAHEILFKEKGSKFYGLVFPMESEEELKQHIEEQRKKYPSAGHHCYGYRINPLEIYERANDDGEPSGTAGNPILGQLQSKEVINSGIIVTRIFGGTKLGTGGLISAYRTSAQIALETADIIVSELTESRTILSPFDESFKVYQLKENLGLDKLIEQHTEKGVVLELQVPLSKRKIFDEWLERFDNSRLREI
ncbi:IMPACT family protein [Luteibaculum oceani]|uniref:YigZ family protein n=1 Tax=Luteibaculum oceani TaxID=1294296 RepID=A0A5C6UVA1_9FLAO|nr:YigZ family protein [Luteibaculum oceani]TXC76161.1 YigZ family protein [Luteibaculum oceani]